MGQLRPLSSPASPLRAFGMLASGSKWQMPGSKKAGGNGGGAPMQKRSLHAARCQSGSWILHLLDNCQVENEWNLRVLKNLLYKAFSMILFLLSYLKKKNTLHAPNASPPCSWFFSRTLGSSLRGRAFSFFLIYRIILRVVNWFGSTHYLKLILIAYHCSNCTSCLYWAMWKLKNHQLLSVVRSWGPKVCVW